jgi:hypothetical protein
MFCAAKSGTKAPTKILLTLTAAAALSFAHPASANVTDNGGFETGDFTGWTHVGGAVVGTQGDIWPHSGNLQAAFISPLGDSLTQSFATTPRASCTVDFWLSHTFLGILLGKSGGRANGTLLRIQKADVLADRLPD